MNRPGVQAMLARLRAREFDAVIVYKLDRLTRAVKDLGHLLDAFQKTRVALASIEENLDPARRPGSCW